jgi:5'-3' exonuclease
MGVDGLYKFINRNFPEIYNNIGIHEIKGKSCIIDGMQHIYSQLIYMRSRDKEVLTPDGKNISHIHGLINSLTYYLKNDIIPIFIFDGKTPDIKKNKIEERKKNLKNNLFKLKELQEQKNNLNEYINYLTNENIDELNDEINKYDNNFIFGTPPNDLINLEEEMLKINNIHEEYKKIYKKSIVMKDYYIKDWIQILELLGLPVIKAAGEADPICAYILKNNSNIFGIISDDSDMLVFGSPILMRKSINQQFTIIELELLLKKIGILLSKEFQKNINFDLNNLIDFSILLGTDYGTFKLNENQIDSLEIIKYYVFNDMDYKKIISSEQYDKFEIIKNYYTNNDYKNECENYLDKPKWNKPNFLDLKKRLLELYVDEDYIDKNNQFIDSCYNKINKIKYNFTFNNKQRSNSFDDNKSYYQNKFNNKKYNDNDETGFFNKLNKNPTFYSDKYYVANKNKDESFEDNNFKNYKKKIINFKNNNNNNIDNELKESEKILNNEDIFQFDK